MVVVLTINEMNYLVLGLLLRIGSLPFVFIFVI